MSCVISRGAKGTTAFIQTALGAWTLLAEMQLKCRWQQPELELRQLTVLQCVKVQMLQSRCTRQNVDGN